MTIRCKVAERHISIKADDGTTVKGFWNPAADQEKDFLNRYIDENALTDKVEVAMSIRDVRVVTLEL